MLTDDHRKPCMDIIIISIPFPLVTMFSNLKNVRKDTHTMKCL